jgi:hypothetical protein
MPRPSTGTQLSLLELDTAVSKAAARRSPAVPKREPVQGALVAVAQPDLPFDATRGCDEPTRAALERRLTIAVGGPVTLTITDNRRTMVSITRRSGARHVRLHHMFAAASPEVVAALGRYFARGDRFASRLIDRFIAANQHAIKPAEASAPAALEPRGAVYDLDEIQRRLSEEYFDGKIALGITWGRHARPRRSRGSRRTIRMGTYFIEEKLIRIHPALDQTFVPRYFVEWVVYHEMLHHVVPMPMVNGRRVYHSAEFRRRERLYVDFERARGWEERHLTRLIAGRRVISTS